MSREGVGYSSLARYSTDSTLAASSLLVVLLGASIFIFSSIFFFFQGQFNSEELQRGELCNHDSGTSKKFRSNYQQQSSTSAVPSSTQAIDEEVGQLLASGGSLPECFRFQAFEMYRTELFYCSDT